MNLGDYRLAARPLPEVNEPSRAEVLVLVGVYVFEVPEGSPESAIATTVVLLKLLLSNCFMWSSVR